MRERECLCAHVRKGEGQRERERERERIPIRLPTGSTQPDKGLKLTNHEIMP